MRWLLALGLLAQASPSADLKVGDRTTIKVTSTLELDIVVRDGTGESTKLLNLDRREEFSQEVLDVAAGRAKSVRITCLSSTLQRVGTGIALEEKPTALANQTYTATRSEVGWSVKDAEGGAPPREGIGLGSWNDVGRLLPGKPVSTGDKWEVADREFLPLIYPTALKEASGRLECTCESSEGGKVEVAFKGSVEGQAKDGTRITLAINVGRLHLVKGKPAFLQVLGALQSTLDVIDTTREANKNEEEKRKVGEINVKSRKLDVTFSFGN